MNKHLYHALISYFEGNIDKHVANIKLHTESAVGVAEHSDHIETIEKELELLASYNDKLSVLKKYFGDGDKEVIHG
jgi:hypothetical protein